MCLNLRRQLRGRPATSCKEVQGEFWLGLVGVVSVLFAILVVLFPGDSAVAIVWAIGAYAVPFGVLLIFLASDSAASNQEMERLAASA